MLFFTGKPMLDFTGLSRKTTGLCRFSPVDQRGSSGCFFLGMLFAFQFVVFHAIRVSGDLEYPRLVNQAVENGHCHGAVLKSISPLGKENVGRQDGGMHLVPQLD